MRERLCLSCAPTSIDGGRSAWHSISVRCGRWWQSLGVALCVACGSSSEHTTNASGGPAGAGGSGGTGTGAAAGGGTGGLGADPSPSALAQALAQVACQQLFGCCTSVELARQFQTWPSVPTDVASCVATISPSLSFNIADSARLGQLKFQPQYADQCLAALAAQSCKQWSPKVSPVGYGSPIAPCAAVLQGTVPVGGDCSGGGAELCESGNCLSLSSTQYECGAAGKVGDACQGSTQVYACRAGLTCTGPQSSTDWTCQPTPRDDVCDGM